MPSEHAPAAAFVWAQIVACIACLGVADYATGYEFNFFIFYFLPVSLAAFRLGLIPSVGVAIVCALTWALAEWRSGHVYALHFIAVWNTVIRLAAFIAIGVAVARIKALLAAQTATTQTLREALAELNVLKGLLPICAQCKSIREEDGRWVALETYITAHSEVHFSHGICPNCKRRLLDEAGISDPHARPARDEPTSASPPRD